MTCDCGGGHAISAASPTGHAVTCPTRAGESRLHRYGSPSELVMWEDEDTEQTGFARRYECVKCGGCPITIPVRDEAVS